MSNQEKCRSYFQFPLSALRIGSNVAHVTNRIKEKRMHEIVRWALFDVAKKLRERTPENEIIAIALKAIERQRNYGEEHARDTSTWNPFILAAAATLNVDLGTSEVSERSVSQYERGMLVRMRTDIFWDALKEWSWREFAVLAAVYGCIGNEDLAQLTYERINFAALGYSSKKHSSPTQQVQLLSSEQIKYTVGKLCKRGFFIQVLPDRRHMYYSNNLSLDDAISLLALRIHNRRLRTKQRSQSEIANKLKRELAELQSPNGLKKMRCPTSFVL